MSPELPERAAHALERSATEPLAVEHSRPALDATVRTLVRERQRLIVEERDASHRLRETRCELDALSWRHRSRRHELEFEITTDERTLAHIERRRSELDDSLRSTPRNLNSIEIDRRRTREPRQVRPAERSRASQPPMLEFGR